MSKRMAVICFVSYEIHPTTAGGCGVLIHHAADRLLSDGHDVVLLLDCSQGIFAKFRDKDRLTFAVPDRVRCYRVDDLCPASLAKPTTVFQRKSLRFATALRAVLEREHVDLVEFFEYCGPAYYALAERLFAEHPGDPAKRPVLACRAHGSIEVLDRHGDGLVADRDQFMLHSFERRSLALAETVLVPSMTYYERYYRDLYRLDPSRVVVSTPPKQPFPRVTSRPDPAGAFSIVFIGRMFHLKGVDQLVHAAVLLMKRRPESRFTVDLIGYDSREGPLGSYTAYLRSLIPARLRDRFVFAGQVRHELLPQRLNNALCAVFPNRIESFCYALHEVYDAGVPVIANALPAFADFFTHDHNALLYDGTTPGLVAALERMIDDEALRQRLQRPYPVAEVPLGDFYARPRATKPVESHPPETPQHKPLVVVLGKDAPLADWPALASLVRQTASGFQTVALVPAPPDGEETLWWLGRSWHARDELGRTIEPSDLRTLDSLAVLHADDQVDPTWLATCRRALTRRDDLAFTGTWETRQGEPHHATLDVAPELHPFEQGERIARVLVRTPPGGFLSDLFDPSLEGLGHTGLVWAAIATHGHGVLLPSALVHTRDPDLPATPRALRALLLRHGGAFADRLTILAGLLPTLAAQPAQSTPTPTGPVVQPAATVEAKIRLADELGGRTLISLALKKLARRLAGKAPPRR